MNLLDIGTEWTAASNAKDVFEVRDRKTGQLKWTGTRVDLVFGSNSQLRALAEVYGSADSQAKFVQDFVTCRQGPISARREKDARRADDARTKRW